MVRRVGVPTAEPGSPRCAGDRPPAPGRPADRRRSVSDVGSGGWSSRADRRRAQTAPTHPARAAARGRAGPGTRPRRRAPPRRPRRPGPRLVRATPRGLPHRLSRLRRGRPRRRRPAPRPPTRRSDRPSRRPSPGVLERPARRAAQAPAAPAHRSRTARARPPPGPAASPPPPGPVRRRAPQAPGPGPAWRPLTSVAARSPVLIAVVGLRRLARAGRPGRRRRARARHRTPRRRTRDGPSPPSPAARCPGSRRPLLRCPQACPVDRGRAARPGTRR